MHVLNCTLDTALLLVSAVLSFNNYYFGFGFFKKEVLTVSALRPYKAIKGQVRNCLVVSDL